MGFYQTEGVVLHSRDFSEADKILTLFTPLYGKIHVIAKGVRKPRSRMRGGVQLFNHAVFMLYAGRNLDTLTQVELKEAFLTLKSDLVRLAHAHYLAELLQAVVPEREANVGLFGLLLAGLHLLETEDPKLSTCFFEIRLLKLSGYCPQLGCCVSCGRKSERNNIWHFSISLGGLLCPYCWGQDPGAWLLEPATLAAMRMLGEVDLKRFSQVEVAHPVLIQLGKILRYYLEYRLERKLKSVAFLHHLELV